MSISPNDRTWCIWNFHKNSTHKKFDSLQLLLRLCKMSLVSEQNCWFYLFFSTNIRFQFLKSYSLELVSGDYLTVKISRLDRKFNCVCREYLCLLFLSFFVIWHYNIINNGHTNGMFGTIQPVPNQYYDSCSSFLLFIHKFKQFFLFCWFLSNEQIVEYLKCLEDSDLKV